MTPNILWFQSDLILFLSGILIRTKKLNTQLFQTPLGISKIQQTWRYSECFLILDHHKNFLCF